MIEHLYYIYLFYKFSFIHLQTCLFRLLWRIWLSCSNMCSWNEQKQANFTILTNCLFFLHNDQTRNKICRHVSVHLMNVYSWSSTSSWGKCLTPQLLNITLLSPSHCLFCLFAVSVNDYIKVVDKTTKIKLCKPEGSCSFRWYLLCRFITMSECFSHCFTQWYKLYFILL